MKKNLDDIFRKSLTAERLQEEFKIYKHIKTDDWEDPNSPKVKIQMGADGVDWQNFEKQQEHLTNNMVKRLLEGKYLFYPLREHIVSKDPSIKNPIRAKKQGKHRVLSIASIRDVLVQKVIYDVIYERAETLFNDLPEVSFGYRKGYSAPLAAKKVYEYINQGYVHVLDADIKKFFDRIPHNKLFEKIESFANDSNIVKTLLKRFIKVRRVKWEFYRGKLWKFRRLRVKSIPRVEGIPQGGILSGLLANLYLHEFDKWACGLYNDGWDLRYVRYADDFVILLKNNNNISLLKEKVREQLDNMGLELHTDPKKTRTIDLTKKGNYVEFVGFTISETGIRVKKQNVQKFKIRINEILNKYKINDEKSFDKLVWRLNCKILGNYAKKRICENCGLPETRRSWLDFFLTITDVQQLKGLDYWLRKNLHNKYYNETGKRLSRKALKNNKLPSLAKKYYELRKEKEKSVKYCECELFEQKLVQEKDLLVRDLYDY